jgi:hypothetical protein
MRRFTRRQAGQAWVQGLPDPFSMHDVLARVPPYELAAALSWLYEAIERGRLDPEQTEDQLLYRFAGQRRVDDSRSTTPAPRESSARRA